LATGFIICGAGVKKAVVLDQISVMDVAPTVAVLLGVDFPDVDGRVLNEILTKSDRK
jgi:hypothetical protein